jgi:hypothetical protein
VNVSPHSDTPDDQEDPAVQAEWRRLETKRLADDRAEAREDAEEASHHPAPKPRDHRKERIAFAIALVAGIIVALLVNRPPRQSSPDESQAEAVRQALESWRQGGQGDGPADAGPRLRRAASSAGLPANRLTIRVGLRDEVGRERLESLLAASGLRIDGDLEAVVQGTDATQAGAAGELLAVSGRPAAVDALLDSLAAASGVMAIEGDGIFVSAAESPGQSPTQPAPAEPMASAQTVPDRVRLWIEIIDLPAAPAP